MLLPSDADRPNMMRPVMTSLLLIALIFAPLLLLSRTNRRLRKQLDPL